MTNKSREDFEKAWTDYLNNLSHEQRLLILDKSAQIKHLVFLPAWQASERNALERAMDGHEHLFKFYGVDNLNAMIKTMLGQIERLQKERSSKPQQFPMPPNRFA